MKILIIGNGFLATSIVERLESEGHKILIFSRTQNSRIQSQQILGDIFDFERFHDTDKKHLTNFFLCPLSLPKMKKRQKRTKKL